MFPINRSILRVELSLAPDVQYDIKVHGYIQLFRVWDEDVNGNNTPSRDVRPQEHPSTANILAAPSWRFGRPLVGSFLATHQTPPFAIKK